MITVIYTIRDRDHFRIRDSVDSLRNSTSHNFQVNVVDYGSKEPYRDKVKEFCSAQNLKYIRVETEGLPWVKSHAINIGARKTDTEFVVSTDVDMLFEGDILGDCIKRYTPKDIFYCRPRWLTRSEKKEKAKLGNYRQVGGFIFIERSVFYELEGFDERIKFWGMEDVEWNIRLMQYGYRANWIESDSIRMYHQWHPSPFVLSNNWPIAPLYDIRPMTAVYNSHYCIMENLFKKYSNPNWGKMITLKERPILRIIKTEEPYILDGTINNSVYRRFFNATKKNKFIKIELGQRFSGRKMARSIVDHATIPYLVVRRILRSMGFDLSLIRNNKYDHFYMYLDLMLEHGLIDYYISDDQSSIYLLFA